MDASVLGSMPEPFALPFPEMLYVQAKIANLTVSQAQALLACYLH